MSGRRFITLSATVCALTLFLAVPAHATTYTWTGAASNLWSNQNNWNPVGVPASGDSLAFPSGASNLANTNDIASGTSFVAIAFNGSGYSIGGNGVVLTSSLTSSGNNSINLPIDVQTNAVIFSSSNRMTIGGSVSGTGSITLNGGSFITFTGTHSYAGTITNSGTICNLNSASLPNATVNNQYYLLGNGTLGAVTNSQILAPGPNNAGTSLPNGSGIFNTGNFSNNASLNMEINGSSPGSGYDQINVTGTVTLAGSLNLAMSGSFVPTQGEVYTLIDNDGADPVSGIFNAKPEGSVISLNASEFVLSYHGGTGNDVTLTCSVVAKTWTGAAGNAWSAAGNWAGGVPQAGDTLLFPGGAANITSSNDLTAGTSFKTLSFTGSGYVLSGNGIVLTSSLTTSGANTVNIPIDVQTNAVTFNSSNRMTIGGSVSGTGPITLNGGSFITFTGTHTYAGTITNSGTICNLNGASLPNATVNNQYYLLGNGTLGAVTNSQIMAPGPNNAGTSLPNGSGIFNTGNFSNNASLNMEINGSSPGTGYDQINVTGTVTLSGTLSLAMSGSFVPIQGEVYTLIDNDGADPVSGIFNAKPEGSVISLNASEFVLSYHGGTGNDVTLTCSVVAKTWTGAAGNIWSAAGNWAGGVPQAGDTLLFPGGAANITSSNDLTAGTSFKTLSFTGSGYVLSGNGIVLTSSLTTSGANTVNIPIDVQTNAVTFNSSNRMTIGGSVSGTGPITLNGGSFLTFTGTHTYAGTITNSGTICNLNGASLPNATVNNQYYLLGNGTLGAVTNSQILAPGPNNAGTSLPNGSGIFNTGNFSNNASLNMEINGSSPGSGYDQINVTGTVTLAGSLNLAMSGSFVPTQGQVYTLIDNDGVDPVSGTFSGLPENTVITINGYQLRLSYAGGTGNDVTLTSLNGKTPSTTSLTSSVNPSVPGQQVTFTASVTNGATGSVTFKDGLTTMGTGTLTSGMATYSTSSLSYGSHSITAEYPGDPNFGGSTSSAVIQTVNTPPSVNASPIGVTAGSAAVSMTIATVADADQPAGSLLVSTSSIPAGIVINNLSNSSGTVTATVAASCSAASGKNVIISVQDATGAISSTTMAVNVAANPAPTLGNYADTSLSAGGSTSVTPSQPPADNGTFTVTAAASTGFTGSVSADSPTGVVSISNANSGSYTITVTATDNCGATDVKTFGLVVASADVEIGKTVDHSSPAVGQEVIFTITATNHGPSDATGLHVTDALPAGLLYLWSTPSSGTTFDSNSGLWNIGALANGASATLEIHATVLQTGSITNTAAITAQNEPDPAGSNNTHSATINGQPAADVVVSKSVDHAQPLIGSSVTFTITVANNGPNDATGVQVTDALPSGLSFVSATPQSGTTYDNTSGLWDVGALANNNSRTLTVTATVSQTGSITNTATKTHGNEFDPNTSNDSATASINAGASSDIAVSKIADHDNAFVGTDVNFTVTATNGGPSDASGVQITDLLPAGLGFVSAIPSSGTTYDHTSGVWNIGALANGASKVLLIIATVTQSGAIVNSAARSNSDQPDVNAANDSASATVNASFSADVSVAKSVSNSTPTVGQNVSFTITVTNHGPSPATSVAVADQLPSALSYVSSVASAGTYDSTSGIWSIGSLANSASATLQITAAVLNEGSITNTATKSSEIEDDPNGNNDSSSVTLNAAPRPATHFAVSIPASVTAGSSFSMTVTALDENNNAVPSYAGTIHFTSTSGGTLPSDYTFVAGDNGTDAFSITLTSTGSQSVTATDTVTASISGSANTTVNPPPATHFSVSAPANTTSSAAFNVTVTALDASNATVPSYTGTVHFSSGSGGTLPADYTFIAGDNGAHTFSVTLTSTGSQSITATDTINASITGSASTSVAPPPATHFSISAPANTTKGAAFNILVTALDASNAAVPGYTGTVHFTSSSAGTLPSDYIFTAGDSGAHTFSVTLTTAGSQSVTATDTVAASITGSANTTVNPPPATHFSVAAPANSTSGVAFNITVTALDASNATVPGYTGTVHVTSSSAGALPADYAFVAGDNGAHTFSVTLTSTGLQSVTATDTITATITGSASTNVAPPPATHYNVTAPQTYIPGNPFSVVVTALDASNTTATSYAGTVHFTTSAGSSTLPSDYTFAAGDSGTHTFSVTLNASGAQTITATDTQAASINGSASTTGSCPPVAAPVASNSGPACVGGTVDLFVSGSGATYSWTGPGGFVSTLQNPTGVTQPGTYTVNVTTPGACGGSVSVSTNVVFNPLPAAAITTSGTVCMLSSGNTAEVPNAGGGATYAWSIANGTITGGIGTPAIAFSAGTNGAVHLSVRVTTASGCSTSASADVTIILGPTITIPSTLSSCGAATVTVPYTLTGHGPWTVQWSDGVTQHVSVAASSRTVNVTSSITLTVTNVSDLSCTTGTTGAAVFIEVNRPPVIQTQPSGQIVAPGSNATFTVAATGQNLHYQWFVHHASGATVPVGTDSSSYTTNPEGNATWFVRINNACGSVDSDSVTATVTTPRHHPAH